jgi:hypothetical protein
MKISAVGVLSLISVALSGVPVWAGPVGLERTLTIEQQIAINQLEARREQIGRQMPEPPKAAPIGRWMSKRIQLDDLINRLKSGQQVAPEEIDQALQATNR